MAGLGSPELLIILVIVLVLFGVGRLSKIGSELGSGIREFKKGLSDGEEPKKEELAAPQSTEDNNK